MGIRVQTTLGVQIGSDANFDINFFDRDPTDSATQLIVDRFTDQLTNTITLPSNQAAVTLTLGCIQDVRGLYMELTGGNVSVVLNASSVPLVLKPSDVGNVARIFLETEITSVVLTGPPGTVVTGVYTVWGFNQPQAS